MIAEKNTIKGNRNSGRELNTCLVTIILCCYSVPKDTGVNSAP